MNSLHTKKMPGSCIKKQSSPWHADSAALPRSDLPEIFMKKTLNLAFLGWTAPNLQSSVDAR